MIEDDESRIDRDFESVFLHCYGIGVSTGPSLAFDECDIGVVAELPRCAHAGDAGADDADALFHSGADSFTADSE